jgi:hypothetical protein
MAKIPILVSKLGIEDTNRALTDISQQLGSMDPISGTALQLSKTNPVLLTGQVGFETDTLSFKLGLDGRTKYNSLTYFYRGLPVAGEPSYGTPHWKLRDDTVRLISNAVPLSTAAWTAAQDASGQLLLGTKSLHASVIINASVVATADTYIFCAFSDNNSNTPAYNKGCPKIGIRLNQPAGAILQIEHTIDIPLNASLAFYARLTDASNITGPTMYVSAVGHNE